MSNQKFYAPGNDVLIEYSPSTLTAKVYNLTELRAQKDALEKLLKENIVVPKDPELLEWAKAHHPNCVHAAEVQKGIDGIAELLKQGGS